MLPLTLCSRNFAAYLSSWVSYKISLPFLVNYINNHYKIMTFDLSTGSDNQEYMYLLKGHEDLRQDERVMQLFGLVNMLLANSPDTLKRHLRYLKSNFFAFVFGKVWILSHC